MINPNTNVHTNVSEPTLFFLHIGGFRRACRSSSICSTCFIFLLSIIWAIPCAPTLIRKGPALLFILEFLPFWLPVRMQFAVRIVVTGNSVPPHNVATISSYDSDNNCSPLAPLRIRSCHSILYRTCERRVRAFVSSTSSTPIRK